MKRIWITRASPGAQATAERLRARGIEPVVAPLLEVRLLRPAIDLAGVGALAFTSANGVAAFAALTEARKLRVFTVGRATAEAARAAGFLGIIDADGDVAALARTIAARAHELRGQVLHAAPLEPAGDLVGDLARAGVKSSAVAVYETVSADVPAGFIEAIGGLDGVLIHSPRAGRRLGEILPAAPQPHLIAYCISPEAARTLAGLPIGPVFTAALPNEDALLSLIVG